MSPGVARSGRRHLLRHGVFECQFLLFESVDQIIVWIGPVLFDFELRLKVGMFLAQGYQMIFAHRYLLLA